MSTKSLTSVLSMVLPIRCCVPVFHHHRCTNYYSLGCYHKLSTSTNNTPPASTERIYKYKSDKWARHLVKRLGTLEKQQLYALLQRDLYWISSDQKSDHQQERQPKEAVDDVTVDPTTVQLKTVLLLNMFPFIGFGFFDNAIMIVAGEYIDTQLGAVLCISTMAAAAVGNWISDLAGLGLAGWVENTVTRLGFQPPSLSAAQFELPRTRLVITIGRALGVTIGCFLGMLPLLFFKSDEDECTKHEHEQ